MTAPPESVVWDITYACPLRCVHCYSESGRRPSRQLAGEDLRRVADGLLALRPRAVVFSGGEPLAVPELPEIVRRVREAGVEAHLYTSGWGPPARTLGLVDDLTKITVSLDGARAGSHDRVRGRRNAFDHALRTLRALNDAIESRRAAGMDSPALGIDVVVLRSTFDELQHFCADVAPAFGALDYIFFGAVLPIGLASRADFAEVELLTPAQLSELTSPSFQARLQADAPASLGVYTSDNGMFQMHPDRLAAGEIPAMQVEPDGRVRAMPVYEGTVGSLLEEDPQVLWERAVSRWHDPIVESLLRSAATPQEWAHATRVLDHRFGSDADRARMARRPAYGSAPSSSPSG